MRICKSCNELKEDKEFYGRKRDGGIPYGKCKLCCNRIAASRLRDYKDKEKEYAGGRCIICGYNRYRGALEFHHLDKNTKSKDYYRMKNWSFESKKEELDKCVLLCSNCHREVEAGLTDLNLYLKN